MLIAESTHLPSSLCLSLSLSLILALTLTLTLAVTIALPGSGCGLGYGQLPTPQSLNTRVRLRESSRLPLSCQGLIAAYTPPPAYRLPLLIRAWYTEMSLYERIQYLSVVDDSMAH